MLENENITGEVQDVQTPDAGETRVSFDQLIEGDYRDEYKERVESIVKNRLKGHAEDMKRLGELNDSLTALGRDMGIESSDPAEIIKALKERGRTDNAQAGEAFSQDETGNEAPIPPEVAGRVKRLHAQVEAAKQLYPELDIASELKDEVFLKLMAAAGGDVRRAYEMKYHERIITNAMQYAASVTEQRLSDSMASRVGRPGENALSGVSAVVMSPDPENLTRAQRSEIKKRVRRGERILW